MKLETTTLEHVDIGGSCYLATRLRSVVLLVHLP